MEIYYGEVRYFHYRRWIDREICMMHGMGILIWGFAFFALFCFTLRRVGLDGMGWDGMGLIGSIEKGDGNI